MSKCECDCLLCRLNRHDICKHMIKCIKRPWSKRPIIGTQQEMT